MTAKSTPPTPKSTPAPESEPAKPPVELWAGGTLVLTPETLQALQKGENTLLTSGKPQYILYASGEPSEDLLIRINSPAAAIFRADSPDIIVPRRCHNDFTEERAALQVFREKEHFDAGYRLRCYDGRTSVGLTEHHERLAVGIWLVTIVASIL